MSKGFVTDDLGKFGPFGKYNEVVVVNNETKTFHTGATLGAAAFIISEACTGTVTLARGGVIDLSKLTAGVLYEIGISSITVNNKDIYVLKR
tara:strand:- start:199 stop:474 length:276 start_codon:yes stop_codon:yes gene_type:complete